MSDRIHLVLTGLLEEVVDTLQPLVVQCAAARMRDGLQTHVFLRLVVPSLDPLLRLCMYVARTAPVVAEILLHASLGVCICCAPCYCHVLVCRVLPIVQLCRCALACVALMLSV